MNAADLPDLPALSEVASEDAPPPLAYRREDRDLWHGPSEGTEQARNNGGTQPRNIERNIEGLPSAGRVTLSGLPFGPTPDQLVPPYLTPEGVTVIYGPGGVGKGYLAVYLTLQLVRTNRRVTIIDFENHPREWGRRAHAMGFSEVELEMAHYLSPFSSAWTLARGSLAEITDSIRYELDDPEARSDYVIIDSFTTASSSEEALGGVRAAQEFFIGIAKLGRAALVIAHVAGGQEKWPRRPFGSVFVHNLARETWAVEQPTEQSDEFTDLEDRGPMTLELRQRKANSGVHAKPQFVTFNFANEQIEVDTNRPFTRTIADMASDVLKRASKPMTVKEIGQSIRADEAVDVNDEVLRKTLMRYPARFSKTQDTPFRWSGG